MCGVGLLLITPRKPLPEWCGGSLPFRSIAAHLRQQQDIIMQDIPDLKYKLVLFVGSEAIELETKDNRTWAPVQRPYVPRLPTTCTHRTLCAYRDISPISHVRVEIQIKSGHLPWTKKVQNIKEIDIQKPFNEYWTSKEHEIMVLGWSPFLTGPPISDRGA